MSQPFVYKRPGRREYLTSHYSNKFLYDIIDKLTNTNKILQITTLPKSIHKYIYIELQYVLPSGNKSIKPVTHIKIQHHILFGKNTTNRFDKIVNHTNFDTHHNV